MYANYLVDTFKLRLILLRKMQYLALVLAEFSKDIGVVELALFHYIVHPFCWLSFDDLKEIWQPE